MKTIYKTGLAFMAAMALLTSCSDDDGGSTNNNTPDGAYLHCKVEGEQFETFTFQGLNSTYATKSGTGDETQIVVMGSNVATHVVGFSTHGITEPGTYELDDLQAVMLYTDSDTEITYDTNECEGAEGTLTITHLDDTKIEGTFEFLGRNEEDCSQNKNITQGSFRGIFVTE